MATNKYYADIDLNDNKLLNANVQIKTVTTLPTSGIEVGQLIYHDDGSQKLLKIYDGTTWKTIDTDTKLNLYNGAMMADSGSGSAGSSGSAARGDHSHPTDTTRVAVSDFDTYKQQTDSALTSQSGTISTLEGSVADLESGLSTTSSSLASHIASTDVHGITNTVNEAVSKKVDKQFSSSLVTGAVVKSTASSGTMELDVKSTVNDQTSTKTVTIPIASDSVAGFISAADHKIILENQSKIQAMQATVPFYPVNIAVSDPIDQSALTSAWQQASGSTGNPSNYSTLLNLYNNHEYMFYDGAWIDRGAATIAVATDTALGAVMGSPQSDTTEGKVYVEADGTMSVIGWDALNADLSNIQSGFNSALDGKVSKSTSTSGTYAYTRTNGTESVTPIKVEHAAHSLVIRDDSGYIYAGSPTPSTYVDNSTTPIITNENARCTTIGEVNAYLATKQDTIGGAASSVVDSDLTANRVVVSNGTGKIAASNVTSAELGYLSGVTSNIQSQLAGKAEFYSATITGDGAIDNFPIAHSFMNFPLVQICTSDGEQVFTEVRHSTGSVNVMFNTAPASGTSFIVTLIGLPQTAV